jgi:hypothetical protein
MNLSDRLDDIKFNVDKFKQYIKWKNKQY